MAGFRKVKISDGEGAVSADINVLSDYVLAQAMDTLSGLCQVTDRDAAVNLGHCWAFGAQGAPFSAGSGLTMRNLQGVIAQALPPPSGAEPSFWAYYLDADELETTLTPAHPTLSRIDLICIRLANQVDSPTELRNFEDAVTGVKTSSLTVPSTRRQLQIQVVAGTPASTPTIPAVPLGYVPWAGALIDPAATNIPDANVWDYRMPIGFKVYDVLGKDAVYDLTAGHWTPALASPAIQSDITGGRFAAFMFPGGDIASRIVSVGLLGRHPSAGAVAKLARVNPQLIALTNTIQDVSASLAPLDTVGNYREIALTGAPIWGNGYNAGQANARSRPTSISDIAKIALYYQSCGGAGGDFDTLFWARFVVAGG